MNKIDLGTISMGNNNLPRAELFPATAPETRETQPEPGTYQMQNDICFNRCESAKSCDLGCLSMEEQGRILDISMKIRNVCPGRRIAVGVVLTEVDANGNEYPRASKIVTVPAHDNASCMDMVISRIRFVIPEDVSVSGSSDICCNCRHFVVRVTTNYIDDASNQCGCCCGN